MHSLVKVALIACLLMVSSIANAASTFVVAFPSCRLAGHGCPSQGSGYLNWNPIAPNSDQYIDLRNVIKFRVQVNASTWTTSVLGEVTILVSLDGGDTFSCLGTTCINLPVTFEPTLIRSDFISIPPAQRSPNALLRLVYRTDTMDGNMSLHVASIQFYRP